MKKKILTLALTALMALFGSNAFAASAGEVAYNFDLMDLEGVQYRLEDFRGSTVMLNFFGTWCGPCRQEAPQLKSMSESYEGKGVQFFQMASSERSNTEAGYISAVTKWRDDYSIPFPILLDFRAINGRVITSSVGTVYDRYGEGYIPHNVVIDRDGIITYSESGFSASLIRSRIEASLSLPPYSVSKARARRGANGMIDLSWEKAPEGDIASWAIYTGDAPNTWSDIKYIDSPNANGTSITPNFSKDMMYFTVNAIDQKNKEGDMGAIGKFAYKPFCQLESAKTMYTGGDQMKIDYWFHNGGDTDADIVIYFVLEVMGNFYFWHPAHGLAEYPLPSPTTVPAGGEWGEVLFDATFPNGIGAFNGAWHMAIFNADHSMLYDMTSLPFQVQ